MCVIFHLDPNVMPNKDKFFNAVYNNWHSWGIVIKEPDGKIVMHKAVPENGENDPEFLYNLLDKHKDCQRVLHIRHTTKGGTSLQNAQPFEVKVVEGRTAYFMHNGTLNSFGSVLNTADAKSDTLEFVEKILNETLPYWNGPKGVGDYSDPRYLKIILDKHWSANSTCLFISNYCEVIEFGTGWSDMDNSEGEGKIRVSNSSYFHNVIRGPENDRRNAAKRAKEAENNRNRFQNDDTYSYGYGGRDYDYVGANNKKPTIAQYDAAALLKSEEVIASLNKLHNDASFDSYEGISALSYVTFDEWASFLGSESEYSNAYTMETIVRNFKTLYKEYTKLKNKTNRMQKHLTTTKVNGKEQKEVVDECLKKIAA